MTMTDTVAASTPTDQIRRIFDAQRQAFGSDRYPSVELRLERLQRLDAMLIDRRQAIRDALAADFDQHHPLVTDLFESGGVIARSRYIQSQLASWMADDVRPLEPLVHGSSTARVIHQPLGVIGNIGPWNFPVESALVMVADMMAAGNRVMVKTSEYAPATAAVLAEAIAEFFDPTLLAAVTGDAQTAAFFASLPFDHLCFTGGGTTARLVAEAAAKNLTPTTLELGGKNPTVFTDSGFEAQLIQRFLYFRVFKGGQVCTSPDYVMVPAGRAGEWVEMAKAAWTELYPNYVGHVDATGAINERHYQRVMGYVDEARNAGVEVVSLNGDEPDPARRQIPMYVAVEPTEDLACMRDEIFGPLTPVITYDDLDQAMSFINDRPSPLAAYLVTRDDDDVERFARTVRSGGMGVNVFGFQGAEPSIPFGGVGASGSGCHAAREGFANFSHTKSVFECADDDGLMHAIRPPYGDLAQAFADAVFTPLEPSA
jgi:coniferyl-aldehyde dehydrogenase